MNLGFSFCLKLKRNTKVILKTKCENYMIEVKNRFYTASGSFLNMSIKTTDKKLNFVLFMRDHCQKLLSTHLLVVELPLMSAQE